MPEIFHYGPYCGRFNVNSLFFIRDVLLALPYMPEKIIFMLSFDTPYAYSCSPFPTGTSLSTVYYFFFELCFSLCSDGLPLKPEHETNGAHG